VREGGREGEVEGDGRRDGDGGEASSPDQNTARRMAERYGRVDGLSVPPHDGGETPDYRTRSGALAANPARAVGTTGDPTGGDGRLRSSRTM
jgi:hypothetical protein